MNRSGICKVAIEDLKIRQMVYLHHGMICVTELRIRNDYLTFVTVQEATGTTSI